jgi:hypothetical protein
MTILILVILLAGSAGVVRAESLEILVTESGGPTIPITDNGVFDTNPTVGVINVDTTLLNLLLVNYSFLGLSASSNSPGMAAPTGAVVTLSGELQLIPGGTGSITISVSDRDFTLPSPPGPVSLFSSASDTFTNSPAGDSHSFTSFYSPTNTLADTSGPKDGPLTFTSSGTAVNSNNGDTAGTTLSPFVIPYALTNRTDITLSGGTAGAPSDLLFDGSTQVLPPEAAAIPEPASSLLLGIGVLLLGFGRRRSRQVAGQARLGRSSVSA